MRLAESIARFESHRRKAYELKEQDISDYLMFTALALKCFQAVNSLIEISQSLIAGHRITLPDTYRHVLEVLHREGIISRETGDAGKRMEELLVVAKEHLAG